MTALAALAAVAFVWWFSVQWVKIPRRWERDLPGLMDNAHLDTPEDPCRWSYYGDYRICLTHGIREGARADGRPIHRIST